MVVDSRRYRKPRPLTVWETFKVYDVAEWDTQLTHALPEELRSSFPTIKEIEAELSQEAGR